MAVDKAHIFEPGIYFVTFTNFKWLQLFEITQSYDLVYKWFDKLRYLGHYVVGYVIMPNHIHALIGFVPRKKSINTIIGNGKRFLAYDIVERLKRDRNVKLLSLLAENVTPSDKKAGKKHEVFEPSFDIKICNSYEFIVQKLNYMHANPVSKKWMLATDSISYKHSSALFYETGNEGVYPVMRYDDLLFSNWLGSYVNASQD